MNYDSHPLIFERSEAGRVNAAQAPVEDLQVLLDDNLIPASQRRTSATILPEVSELQTVRHYTQ